MDSSNTFSSFFLQIFIFLATFFGINIQENPHELPMAPQVSTGVFDNTSIFEVYFCPQDNCLEVFTDSFQKATKKIDCALYDINEKNLVDNLNKVSNQNITIRIITDNEYLHREPFNNLSEDIKTHSDINRDTLYNNYMHHKFCIIDNNLTIISSANPTDNGFYKNNNNILEIESDKIAKNFQEEFNQMNANIFGTNKKTRLHYQNITLIDDTQDIEFHNYFCPQDNCKDAITNILNKSQKEIQFASFVLTLDSIENLLLEKNLNRINVTGIIERRTQNSQGSIVDELEKEFTIIKDNNPNTMHHKFFIVDETWVITGSMNPSNSGTRYNDENLIIIKNKQIAKLYKQEFMQMANSWS